MELDISKAVEKIAMQAIENQEEFIFETIRPYCENILEMKINKEELKQILLKGMQKQQPCEDCISRKDLLEKFTEECTSECACCMYVRDGYSCGLIEDAPSVTPTYDLEGYSTKLWKLAYERGKTESEDKK